MSTNPSRIITPSRSLSRRAFVRGAAASTIGVTFIPHIAWGANDKIQVGCCGIGGKGYSDVSGAAGAGGQIVALCDVDDKPRGRKGRKDHRENFPDAKFYYDFREMLDKQGDEIDAVTVSTPDHMHCLISVTAMRMGKHVYCQKPLTHDVWEARVMAETAIKYGVATQMGNQAHAGTPIRRAVEMIRAGLLGKVNEVHCWTNRPIWPQGMKERPEPQPVPENLKWDLWIGTAPMRPYNSAYHPFKWRGWWDFGTGALGDMACHIMDMPFWALNLRYPDTVEAKSEGCTEEAGPTKSVVTYTFPPGPFSNRLKFSWWDGGYMPPDEVLRGLPTDGKGTLQQKAKRYDMVLIGERGKMFFNRGNTRWLILPAELEEDVKDRVISISRPRDEDHEWMDACRGWYQALSNFTVAGPFTETVVLGNLAIRLGKKIEWDGPNVKAKNAPEADRLIRRQYRDGWEVTREPISA